MEGAGMMHHVQINDNLPPSNGSPKWRLLTQKSQVVTCWPFLVEIIYQFEGSHIHTLPANWWLKHVRISSNRNRFQPSSAVPTGEQAVLPSGPHPKAGPPGEQMRNTHVGCWGFQGAGAPYSSLLSLRSPSTSPHPTPATPTSPHLTPTPGHMAGRPDAPGLGAAAP